jgi:iron(III) transport system substrate-binding protein
MIGTKILRYIVFLQLFLAACGKPDEDSEQPTAAPEFVVVYTSMDELLLAPLYEGFLAASGIRIQQVSADYDRLLEMMRDKQRLPAADIFMARNTAALWNAASEDVFRPTYSDDLDKSVPSHLRDSDKLFAAIAFNADAIIFDQGIVPVANAPADYESLADPEWRGKVCLTSSSRPENLVWVSLLISRHGKREAELIVRRLVSNLAMPVFDEVAQLIVAIESAQCGAAIADLYTSVAWLAAHGDTGLKIVTPAAAHGGTTFNIVGAGVTRHAANPEGAARFIEWLAGSEGQQSVVESRVGLPVSGAVELPPPFSPYKALQRAEVDVSQLGSLDRDAALLAERAHYP